MVQKPRRLLFVCLVIPALFTPSAALSQGAIEGTVTFWGDSGNGAFIEVGAHTSQIDPPDVAVAIGVGGGAYSIPVDNGTYYISAWMGRARGSGGPQAGDLLGWYDADADGDPDTVTVNGGTVTGVDFDMGFVYVDIDANGANNGSSWADAFNDLQSGIDLAVSGIQVWVAEGTYVPGTSRSASFLPKPGVRVYGGFTGGETVLQQRDWRAHPTILSGEIGTAAATDNCYHVIRAEGSNPTAMLNGVTITRGYANGAGFDDQGGGVRARGGGVTLANATVIDNYAVTGGGIMANLGGAVSAFNTAFVNNQAPGFEGGAYYGNTASSQPLTLVNCVFTGNSAWRGGGIAFTGGGLQPVLVNLSLANNSAGGEGGGIYVNSSIVYTIHNSILWGNTGPNPQISAFAGVNWPTVNYSIIQGGWTHGGTQVIDLDPSFADADLRLALDSPAIDAGDSTAIPMDSVDLDEDLFTDHPIPVDFDLNERTANIPSVPDTGIPDDDMLTVDMGAYESFDLDLIFWDGFESGDLEEWDNVAGGS